MPPIAANPPLPQSPTPPSPCVYTCLCMQGWVWVQAQLASSSCNLFCSGYNCDALAGTEYLTRSDRQHAEQCSLLVTVILYGSAAYTGKTSILFSVCAALHFWGQRLHTHPLSSTVDHGQLAAMECLPKDDMRRQGRGQVFRQMGNYCFWPELQDIYGDWRQPWIFLSVLKKSNWNKKKKTQLFVILIPSSVLCIQTSGEGTRKGPTESTPTWPTCTRYSTTLTDILMDPHHYMTVMWKKQINGYKRRGARSRRSAASAPSSNARPRSGRLLEIPGRGVGAALVKVGLRGVRGCCRTTYDLINLACAEKRVLSEGWLAKYWAHASYFWVFNIAYHVSLVKQKLFIYYRQLEYY